MNNYTAEDLIKMLRKRYTGNEYVVLEQVPDGTGMMQSRWVDAAVFNLWPSKGLTRAAFEVKVSRSDFIRELQNQLKHKWVRESFHEFWIVAPKDIVQLGELPPGVGWMAPHAGKLGVKRMCQRNTTPKLDDVLLAAFMRAAYKEISGASSHSEKDILANSAIHKTAKVYEEAVHKFWETRGVNAYFYSDELTVAEVIKRLDKATVDKELADDIEHLTSIAEGFQREIVSLFSLFAVLAHKALLARNELGKHIVARYGGRDEAALEVLIEHYTNKKHDGPYLALIELLLAWGKKK